MKTKNSAIKWFLLVCFLAAPFLVLGQIDTTIDVTNGLSGLPPEIDPVTAPLPTTTIEYWQFAIPIVVPLIIAGLKWAGARMPRRVIPFVSPALGLGLGVLMQWLTSQDFSWMTTTVSGLLGGTGTWLREAVDQNIVQPNTPAAEKIVELKEKIAEVQEDPRATT